MLNRILVAADFSEECARALPVAIDGAHQYRAELHVVVVEPVLRALTEADFLAVASLGGWRLVKRAPCTAMIAK